MITYCWYCEEETAFEFSSWHKTNKKLVLVTCTTCHTGGYSFILDKLMPEQIKELKIPEREIPKEYIQETLG